jgi:hypothetical protein
MRPLRRCRSRRRRISKCRGPIRVCIRLPAGAGRRSTGARLTTASCLAGHSPPPWPTGGSGEAAARARTPRRDVLKPAQSDSTCSDSGETRCPSRLASSPRAGIFSHCRVVCRTPLGDARRLGGRGVASGSAATVPIGRWPARACAVVDRGQGLACLAVPPRAVKQRECFRAPAGAPEAALGSSFSLRVIRLTWSSVGQCGDEGRGADSGGPGSDIPYL